MISFAPLNGLLYMIEHTGGLANIVACCVLAMVSVNFRFGIRLRARLGEE